MANSRPLQEVYALKCQIVQNLQEGYQLLSSHAAGSDEELYSF